MSKLSHPLRNISIPPNITDIEGFARAVSVVRGRKAKFAVDRGFPPFLYVSPTNSVVRASACA